LFFLGIHISVIVLILILQENAHREDGKVAQRDRNLKRKVFSFQALLIRITELK